MKELLSAFNAHNVEYLVVGAYAVGVHSEPRATKDLDIWIRTSEVNSVAVFEALAAFGAPLAGLTPASFRDEPDSIFQIGLAPFRIDLMQSVKGVAFDEAWEHRVEGIIDGEVRALVISRHHLIQSKLAVGRLQDLADVERVREAAEQGSEPEASERPS